MSRTTVTWLLVSGFAVSSAFAGVVEFDPSLVEVEPGTPAVFDVSVASTEGGLFQALGIFFGLKTYWGGPDMSWEYDPDFVGSCSLPPSDGWTTICDPWGCDFFVFGMNFRGWSTPLRVGTLTVDTTDLADITEDFVVGPDAELELFGTLIYSVIMLMDWELEPLGGRGTIHIVPEPTALTLLGIAGLGVLRRRRG